MSLLVDFLPIRDTFWLMLPVNVLLLVLLPWGLSRRVAPPGFERRYFLLCSYLYVATGLGIYALHQLVYGGGDYNAYEKGTAALVQVAYRDPAFAWELIQNFDMQRRTDVYIQLGPSVSSSPEYSDLVIYFGFGAEERIIMIYFFTLGLLSGAEYQTTVLLQAILTSIIHFKFAQALAQRYPSLAKPLFSIVLFVPGVIIWGTAIAKDSILLNAILLIVLFVFQPKRMVRQPLWLGLLVLHIVLAYQIRPFILVLLVPLLLLMALQQNLHLVSGGLRHLVQPLVYGLAGIGLLVLLVARSETFAQQTEQITQQAIVTSSYQTRQALQDRGVSSSAYTLGDYSPTPVGILATFPIATATALFRPLPWEVRNPLMVGNMLESLGLLLAALYVLVRLGPLRLARTISADPFLVFCLLFTLLYGFLVGFTSGNYGSLWRYRIPIVVFFPVLLVVANSAVSARKHLAPAV